MKLFLSIILLAVFTGCSSTKIHHLNSEEFLNQAELTDGLCSSVGVQYIGASHNRVYLETYTFSLNPFRDSITIIHWTELEGLPLEIVEQIRSGNSPWKTTEHESYDKAIDDALDKTPGLRVNLTE